MMSECITESIYILRYLLKYCRSTRMLQYQQFLSFSNHVMLVFVLKFVSKLASLFIYITILQIYLLNSIRTLRRAESLY
jgi:hypothetical protein